MILSYHSHDKTKICHVLIQINIFMERSCICCYLRLVLPVCFLYSSCLPVLQLSHSCFYCFVLVYLISSSLLLVIYRWQVFKVYEICICSKSSYYFFMDLDVCTRLCPWLVSQLQSPLQNAWNQTLTIVMLNVFG